MIKTIKKPSFWIISILVAGLTVASLHRLEQLEALQSSPEQHPAPMVVHGVEAVKGSISRWVCGEGTVAIVRKRHLFFQASGKVVFLGRGNDGQPLQEGSRVRGPGKDGKNGTYLASIDNRAVKEEIRLIQAQQAEADHALEMAHATLDQAEKNLALARNRYDRSKKLYNVKVVTLSALEEDKTAWQNALSDLKVSRAKIKGIQAEIKGFKAKYDQVLVQLENMAIYAPFNGVIARLNITEGDYFDPARIDHTNPDSLLATAPITIIDPGEVEVTLNLPVFDGIRVAPGQHCTIQMGSTDWHQGGGKKALPSHEKVDPAQFIQARVYSVSPVISINGRTIRVKVRAEQDKAVLPHGMFVTCWIETEKISNALLIPMASLLFRDDQAYVYVENKGVAQQRHIRIGIRDQDRVEVLEGVFPGEQIITKGRYRLFPGRPVRVIKGEGGREDEA